MTSVFGIQSLPQICLVDPSVENLQDERGMIEEEDVDGTAESLVEFESWQEPKLESNLVGEAMEVETDATKGQESMQIRDEVDSSSRHSPHANSGNSLIA